MNTGSLLHAVALPSPFSSRQATPLRDRLRFLVAWFQAWRSARAQLRRNRQIEQDLAHLSLHTLRDIGAPPSLIGRRRAQEAQEALVAKQRALDLKWRS